MGSLLCHYNGNNLKHRRGNDKKPYLKTEIRLDFRKKRNENHRHLVFHLKFRFSVRGCCENMKFEIPQQRLMAREGRFGSDARDPPESAGQRIDLVVGRIQYHTDDIDILLTIRNAHASDDVLRIPMKQIIQLLYLAAVLYDNADYGYTIFHALTSNDRMIPCLKMECKRDILHLDRHL